MLTYILCAIYREVFAGVAQLVEHLICNQRVGGSNPFASSNDAGSLKRVAGRVLGLAGTAHEDFSTGTHSTEESP